MKTPPQGPAEVPSETGEEGVVVEAPRFEEAIAQAASRLGIPVSELGIHVIDPGRSESAAGGYRPVRIRAWKRGVSEAPDGARTAASPARGARVEAGGSRIRRGYERGEAPSYGPPPPPMDPARISPELVEETRALCEGLVRSMGFEARAAASKTKHGIRIEVEAGEDDHHLIGRDGETLGSLQYMVARMLRARLREDSMPRIEVDVAGYRDRRNEELREMARELMEEARRSGGEAVSEPLQAAERRVIHLEVGEAPGFTTVTIGEGEYKRVVVKAGEPEGAS